MRKQPAPLVIPGAPKKGEAAPAVRSFEAESLVPAPVPVVEQPPEQPPAPPPSAPTPRSARAAPEPAPAPPSRLSSRVQATIAVTVRLDEMRYERMKRWGTTDRRVTNQEIIVAALDKFFALSDDEREDAIAAVRR
jgi:hypothetical protein